MRPDVPPTHHSHITVFMSPVFQPQPQCLLPRVGVTLHAVHVYRTSHGGLALIEFPFLQTEVTELQQLLASKNAEIESLQNQLLSRGNINSDGTERGELVVSAENAT